MRRTLLGLLLGASLALAPLAAHATSTVATFSDPSPGAGSFLFVYRDTTNNGILDGVLTGSFLGTGLDLKIQGVDHFNTTFSMTPLQGTGFVGFNGLSMTKVGGGTGEVVFSNGGPLLDIDFAVAHLTISDVGATDIQGDAVNIHPPSGPDPFSAPESFAFSFANGTVESGTLASILTGNSGTVAWTAAFTSSAAVPEPGTLLLLGSGLVGLGALARRRFA